jgi:hypothetical protein
MHYGASLSAKAQENAANSGVFNFQQNESLLSVLEEIENKGNEVSAFS